jgi:two-component system CheB/CheR fusion protein
VPGCSTGEEAFSALIVIEEALEELNRYPQVQVFGTDLDNDAIAAARRAVRSPSAGSPGPDLLAESPPNP